MTWVKIDDGAHAHPKLLAAGPEAVCLWLAGLCYANTHATDGTVPAAALAALYPTDEWSRADRRRLSAKLVEVGLWVAVEGGGWSIHDYSEHQSEALREVRDERRAFERERKAKQRQAKRTQQESMNSDVLRALSQRDTRGTEGGAVPRVSQAPGPSRPVQTSPVPEERETPPPPEGGTPRLGTVERQGYTADALAVTLTQRAKGKILAAGADAQVLVRLQRAMDALARGPLGATRASYETLADWYAAGAQDWRAGRLTLRELADGRLGEHLEAALEWDRTGRRPPTREPAGRHPGATAPRLKPAPVSDWPGYVPPKASEVL